MTESIRIYEAMKQDIIFCELGPGVSVSEAELCSRYGSGRTPVREACRRLHEESLIEIIPFRGYFVASLTVSEFHNLLEAQLVIEPAAAALAAERATPAEARKIQTLAEYEYRQGVRTSYSTFLERNYALHTAIAEASRNEIFVDMIANMQERMMRYFYLVISMDGYGRELVGEHRAIAKAIKRHDPVAAREKSLEHLRRTMERSTKLNFGSIHEVGPSRRRATGVKALAGRAI